MICLELNSTSLSKGNTNPFIYTNSTTVRQRELTASAGTTLSQKEKLLSIRLGSMCSTGPALFPKISIHLNHGIHLSGNCKWPHVTESKDLPMLLCILFHFEKFFQVSLLNSSSSRECSRHAFPFQSPWMTQNWYFHAQHMEMFGGFPSQQEVSNPETEHEDLISARVTVVKQFPGFNIKISYSCG